MPDLRTRCTCLVDEQRVEHGAARRVECADAVPCLDREVEHLIAIVKRRRAYRRRAGSFEPIDQAPAFELQDPAAHQRVGRERIATVGPTIDRQHTQSASREQHRGRGARAASTYYHGVVASCFAVHRGLLRSEIQPASIEISTGDPLVRTSKTAERARDCSTICRSFSSGASPLIEKFTRIFW